MPVPRFSDTDTKAAPTTDPTTEHTLKVIKQKVMTLYKNRKPQEEANHQESDVHMSKELGNDPDIISKRSDKCKGLVVMSKNEYVQKAHAITDGYETIDKNPTPKLEAKTKILVKCTYIGG